MYPTWWTFITWTSPLDQETTIYAPQKLHPIPTSSRDHLHPESNLTLDFQSTLINIAKQVSRMFVFRPNFNEVQPCQKEKAMAPHSSILAWKIPWMEEPGRLHSMGSLRVGHDWATSLSLFTFIHWRRKWQPTPVLLPGGSQGRESQLGCRLWGHTESATTEATWQQQPCQKC